MSLKAFHVFFILISIVLAFGFGLWAFLNSNSAWGTGAAVLGIGLVFYLAWFIRKSKKLKHSA